MKKFARVFLPLLLIIIIFISIYYSKIHMRPDSPEVTLERSFASSGATLVNSEIYFWGRLDDGFNDIENLHTLADAFSKEFGVIRKGELTDKVIQNDNTQKVEIQGATSDGYTAGICVQLDNGGKDGREGFISLAVTDDSKSPGFVKIKDKAMKVFNRYQIQPKVNSCITGNYTGKLDNTRLNGICLNIFKEALAKKVEGMRDENLISISAFSPYIHDGIEVNGKKINLNLAIRYNATENRTYIWVATPVIMTEY